jgi:hypothetical protein
VRGPQATFKTMLEKSGLGTKEDDYRATIHADGWSVETVGVDLERRFQRTV